MPTHVVGKKLFLGLPEQSLVYVVPAGVRHVNFGATGKMFGADGTFETYLDFAHDMTHCDGPLSLSPRLLYDRISGLTSWMFDRASRLNRRGERHNCFH